MIRSSCSDNKNYPQFCGLAASGDDLFYDFRRNEEITRIIETVWESGGQEYLDVILGRSNIGNLAMFQSSDRVGNPVTYNYYLNRKFWFKRKLNFSPTTLRYMKVLSDLVQLFGDLNGKNVIEIGGGYGGQAKVINNLFEVKKYYLVDLPEVNKLSARYLKEFKIKNVYQCISDQLPDEDFDLVISNYAFSELHGSLQKRLSEKVLSRSHHGYLTVNCTTHSWEKSMFKIEDYSALNPNVKIIENANLLPEIDKKFNVQIVTW